LYWKSRAEFGLRFEEGKKKLELDQYL